MHAAALAWHVARAQDVHACHVALCAGCHAMRSMCRVVFAVYAVGLKESSSAGLKASLDALKSKSAANLTAAPSPGPSSAPHSPQAVTPQLSLPSLVPRADSASGAASLATRDRSVRLALAPSIGSLSDASSEADSDAGCGSPTGRSPSQAEEDDAKRARFRRRASRLSAVVYNDASGPLDLSGPLSQLLQPPDDNNDSNTDELYMLLNSADALNSNLNSKSGRVKGVGVRREKCEFEQRARSHSTLGFVTAAELSGAGLGGRAQRVSSSTALPPLQHPVLAARASQSSAQVSSGSPATFRNRACEHALVPHRLSSTRKPHAYATC